MANKNTDPKIWECAKGHKKEADKRCAGVIQAEKDSMVLQHESDLCTDQRVNSKMTAPTCMAAIKQCGQIIKDNLHLSRNGDLVYTSPNKAETLANHGVCINAKGLHYTPLR